MHVEVEDHLPAAPFNIEEQFIPWFGNGLLLRYLLSLPDHFGNNSFILFREVVEASDMSPGDDEKAC